jgi:hypothetical protein
MNRYLALENIYPEGIIQQIHHFVKVFVMKFMLRRINTGHVRTAEGMAALASR